MKRLEKLMFTIGLIDKTQGPSSRILSTLDKVNRRTQQGIRQSATGAAGLFGLGYSLKGILSPAIEMDRALGEIKSLDVSNEALKSLTRTALTFSTQYGDSAVDFVKSSYDIQSAIAGLQGNELAKFTESSNLLAKATKADAATITDYMGTLYGIFKNQAAAIGNTNWVQQLTGQTATAVQMFKTTGAEMAGAFGTLGAEATAGGIAMSEQMAILGTLQATMSGSEAGTKYKSFLAGIGKAQDKLGLRFTDNNGKMLSMPVILQRIYDKFGQIDTVAKSDLLQKAFGRKEAVSLIKLLMADMDGLNGSMLKLSRVTGMDKAVAMAEAQIDPWQRTAAAIKGVAIAFGTTLLPILTPVLNSITTGGETLIRWIDLFPNVTRVVGYTTLAVVGLAGAMAGLAIVSGIFTVLGAGLTLLFSPVFLITAGIIGVIALVGYGVVKLVEHWDTLKARGQAMVSGVVDAFQRIPNFFIGLKNWFSNLDLFSFLDGGILEKLTGFMGIADNEKKQLNDTLANRDKPDPIDLPTGGVIGFMGVNNPAKNIGDVHIHTTQKPDGFFIHDELEALAT